MMEFLRNWILNIVVLSVVILLIEILVPSSKMKKFVNLASGFILLIAIISPLAGFLKKGINIDQLQLQNSSLLDREVMKQDQKNLKDSQMKQVTELYRRKLAVNVEESIGSVKGVQSVKAEIDVEDDHTKDSYGEIKKVALGLKPGDKEETRSAEIRIEKIQIGQNKAAQPAAKQLDDSTRKEIENRIMQLLGVKRENIQISVIDES